MDLNLKICAPNLTEIKISTKIITDSEFFILWNHEFLTDLKDLALQVVKKEVYADMTHKIYNLSILSNVFSGSAEIFQIFLI